MVNSRIHEFLSSTKSISASQGARSNRVRVFVKLKLKDSIRVGVGGLFVVNVPMRADELLPDNPSEAQIGSAR
jgi:hypothetical protein